MRKTMVVTCTLALAACSGGVSSDPSDWTCASLIQPVIEMSQEQTPTVLEITEPVERYRLNGPQGKLECSGRAEWSQGYGNIEYGAHVSDGGNIVLQYRQR